MLTSIVAAACVFALLVVVHEAGHFIVAKRLGVRVIRFSVGYPPKIAAFRRGETEYALGATPFGGYVKMLGEEMGDEPRSEELVRYLSEIGLDLVQSARLGPSGFKPDKGSDALRMLAAQVAAPGNSSSERAILGRDMTSVEARLIDEIVRRDSSSAEAIKTLAEREPAVIVDSYRERSFPTQPLWKRVAIVLAGPTSKIIFAPLLLTAVFMTGVPTLLPIVGEISAGLPAASAGLKPGDKILAMDSKPVDEWGNFAGSIRNGGGKPIRLEFERLAGATPTRMTVTITPTKITQKAPFGGQSTTWVMGVKPRGDVITRRFGIARSGREAIRTSWTMTVELVDGIYGIIAGSTPVKEALGGPIMIAQIAGREAHQGFASLAMFTVMLSLELGLINLLPVPLLDGGHLLFFFFEGAMGRPLELRYREVMLQVGLSLLVALMAFVIFNDIARLVQG